MRWLHVLASLSAFTAVVFASEEPATPAPIASEPEVVASAVFPETNPFQQVVNGERNSLTVHIENKSEKNVTLLAIGGSLSNPDTGVVVKNLTDSTFNFELIEGLKMQLPFTFFSEHRPGDLRLNVWLDHSMENAKHRVMAYDSIISVVEPEKSFFDFQMLSTYFTLLITAGAFAYFTYLNLVPPPKKVRKTKTEAVSEPVGTVTATGAGGYQEEWIPEHHIRKVNKSSKNAGVATSGDELGGSEKSGVEGLKKKSKSQK